MRRIACVRILNPLIAHFLQRNPNQRRQPIALLKGTGRTQTICALSRSAFEAGLRVGMLPQQAEAVLPTVRFVLSDASATQQEWERLAILLERFSPSVEIAGHGLFYLDAHGMGRLYTDIRDYLAHLRAILLAESYPARAAVAGSRFSAFAATYLAESYVVTQGKDRQSIARLSVRLLPLSPSLADALLALGIQTLGKLAALPDGQVEARFGREGIEMLRLARGEDPSPLRPFRHTQPPTAELTLDGPLEGGEAIRFVLSHLCDRFISQLSSRGLACDQARLYLRLENHEKITIALRPAAATVSARLLWHLALAALEHERLAAPVVALRLESVQTSPAAPEQKPLFMRAIDNEAAHVTLAKLQAALGDDAVLVPKRIAAYRPENRIRWEPPERTFEKTKLRDPNEKPHDLGEVRAGIPSEGIRLCMPPLPMAIRTDTMGRPVWAQCAWVWGPLAQAEGPERLSGEWWSYPYDRDYYLIDWTTGERAWVFLDRLHGGWYLHGLYD